MTLEIQQGGGLDIVAENPMLVSARIGTAQDRDMPVVVRVRPVRINLHRPRVRQHHVVTPGRFGPAAGTVRIEPHQVMASGRPGSHGNDAKGEQELTAGGSQRRPA